MKQRCAAGAIGAILSLAGWPARLPAAGQDRPAAVVKAAAPKTIDGDAADWADLKAEQVIAGPDGEAARFKIAYDGQNLYALVQVQDDSPLRNTSQILPELLKGGDAVGFCFGPAGGKSANQRLLVAQVGDKPVHVALRPAWPEKKPYTYHTDAVGDVKMDFVAPLAEVQAAFKAREGGYALEARIPWSALGYDPAEGMEFPFDVQVIFSNAAGTANVDTRWWRSTGQGPASTMDIATEAKLYPEAWGRARLYARDPGPRRERRARDEEDVFTGPGVPIAFDLPRDAAVSLIITEGRGWVVRELLRAVRRRKGRHTVYWDGRDRTGQPMPPGEYGYRLGIFDGIKTSFCGSVGNSGRPVYRTPDGHGSIGGTHGGPSAVGAGADGIAMLNSGEEGQKCMRLIDPATGRAKWWASTGTFGNGFAVIQEGAFVFMIFGKDDGANLIRFKAATGEGVPSGKRHPVPLGKVKPQGLAVVGEKAFFSDPAGNRLGVVDLKTGNAGQDVAVPSPRGLCKLDDGNLLACSGQGILKVHAESGRAAPLIQGLASPRAVAVDPQGNIFVADQGPSQQIKKFCPQGRRLAAFGKEGGRGETAIPYDPLAFRDVAGLAFGPDGNLWLVESASPRRFAKLAPDGRWLEDFYGPTGYITVGIDLDDFSQVYYQATQYGPAYVKTKIDYAAYARRPGDPVGAWKVEALHLMSQNGTDQSARPDLMSETATASYGKALIFTGTNGKRYFWKPAGDSFALWRQEGGRWVSAAAARKVRAGNAESWAVWSDAGGDGLVQDAEVSAKAPPTGGFAWIDRDLTLHGLAGSWKPAAVDERGVPRYDGGAFSPFFPPDARPIAFYLDQENYGYAVSPPAPDGARYCVSNIGPERGQGFWDRASETRLIRMKDGRPQWIIGHHDGRMLRDGDNQMLINLAGEVDGVVLGAEVWGEFTAYTADGLTLGWISKDAQGRIPDDGPLAWYVENVQPGIFLKDPKTGKRLLFGASTEDVRVLEIAGVFGSEITRLDGKVVLAPAPPRPEPAAGRISIPYRSWAQTGGGRYVGIEGYDWEWSRDLPAIRLGPGSTPSAEVRLRRDAGALCVFAHVLDKPAFPASIGPESFGKSVGIEILIGPAVPVDRKAPAPGDTRIFMTAKKEGGRFLGAAYACRPASKPLIPAAFMRRMNNKGEYEGAPPGAGVDFAAGLAPIPGASVAVMERFDGHGYRLEAEIPLAFLPELAAEAPVQILRQHGVNRTETRPDLAGPFRFNAAAWVNADGGVRRIAWVNDGAAGADPRAMNPSAWGWANVQVALSWPEIDGAQTYTLYRSAGPDPAEAAVALEKVADTAATDMPGLGTFYYWLAAVDGGREGQWQGPMQAREGVASFAVAKSLPPYPIGRIPGISVYPGSTVLVNVAAPVDGLRAEASPGVTVRAKKRAAGLWALMVAASPTARPGETFPVKLSDQGRAFDVTIAPVPVDAYGVQAHIVANADVRQVRIASDLPADGAGGRPATALGGSGKGALAQRAVGRHGYVLFNAGGQAALRSVKAPFADTFAGTGPGFAREGMGYTPTKFIVDGKEVMADGWKVPGEGHEGRVRIEARDGEPHLLTLMTTERFGNGAAPTRFTVSDAEGKASWALAELEGPVHVSVIQFAFRGTITLGVKQVGRGPVDSYDCSNIAALFLD